MGLSREIIVSHANSGIEYTGNWVTNDGTNYDSVGDFGATYRGLAGATGAASLFYAFNGSIGRIIGTNNVKNLSGVLEPVWECFIDGVSIGHGNATLVSFSVNNWPLCEWSSLAPGEHTIAVIVNSQSQTFFFDRLEYQPSVQIDGAEILVSYLDYDLQYDSSWQRLGITSYITQETGATVTFPFVGTGLSWYGLIPTTVIFPDQVATPHEATTATYSIDGGSPVTFSVPSLPYANSTSRFNQKNFETPTLLAGSHNLTVTLIHGGNVWPLVLEYLIIDSGSTALLRTESSVSSGTPTTSGSTSTTRTAAKSSSISTTASNVNSPDAISSKGNTSVGAIVGGVIGAVALLLLFLGILCYRRRRQGLVSEAQEVKPFIIPEEQNFNSILFPSLAAQQSSFNPTPMSKNAASRTIQESNCRLPGAVGNREAISHQTPAPVLALNHQQRMSAAIITTNSGSGPGPGSMPDPPLRVVIHQDSGMRLPEQEPDVVEYPPIYTPG